MRDRTTLGTFTQKGDEPRKVRSLRATEAVWRRLNEKAAEQGLTAADLLEALVLDFPERLNLGDKPGQPLQDRSADIQKAIAFLESGLPLKTGNGGEIKKRIRSALAILNP